MIHDITSTEDRILCTTSSSSTFVAGGVGCHYFSLCQNNIKQPSFLHASLLKKCIIHYFTKLHNEQKKCAHEIIGKKVLSLLKLSLLRSHSASCKEMHVTFLIYKVGTCLSLHNEMLSAMIVFLFPSLKHTFHIEWKKCISIQLPWQSGNITIMVNGLFLHFLIIACCLLASLW